MEEFTNYNKCKEFNLRIGNIGIAKAGYLCDPPEHPTWHINKYQSNPHYGKEAEYTWSEDGTYATKPDAPYWHVNKSCFNHPETCYAIAGFEYDKHEHFYEMRFVGDRPLENLEEEEVPVFWELIKIGNTILNKTNHFDFSNKEYEEL